MRLIWGVVIGVPAQSPHLIRDGKHFVRRGCLKLKFLLEGQQFLAVKHIKFSPAGLLPSFELTPEVVILLLRTIGGVQMLEKFSNLGIGEFEFVKNAESIPARGVHSVITTPCEAFFYDFLYRSKIFHRTIFAERIVKEVIF